MLMRRGTAVLLLLALVAGVAAVACSESDRDAVRTRELVGAESSTPQYLIAERVVVAQGYPPLLNAASLEAMVAAYDTIVVGDVVSSQNMSCVKPGDSSSDEHSDETFEYPTWHPKARSTPLPQVCEDLPPTVTNYAVKVSESYRPNVAAGDTITIQQLGGVKDGVAYQGEGDPVLEIGHTYLFFLRPATPSDPLSPLVGSGFGRFEIDSSGKLSVVDPSWEYLNAVSDLEKLSLNQVQSSVDAAVAAGPPPGFAE